MTMAIQHAAVDAGEERARRLEQVYLRIQRTRMADLPLSNPALRVRCVGFSRWDECWLGVLITPWCMNLVLFPVRAETWEDMQTGATVAHDFPAGRFVFIVAREDTLGVYQSCSLFSPVFEFANQDAAEATAKAALSLLMEQSGALPLTDRMPDREEVAITRRGVSRRDLLRGRLSRSAP